jgi:hypothetical protein
MNATCACDLLTKQRGDQESAEDKEKIDPDPSKSESGGSGMNQ